MDKKLWNDSHKCEDGFSYDSDIGIAFMVFMSKLAWELQLRKTNPLVYETFFNETTDKIKELLNG